MNYEFHTSNFVVDLTMNYCCHRRYYNILMLPYKLLSYIAISSPLKAVPRAIISSDLF